VQDISADVQMQDQLQREALMVGRRRFSVPADDAIRAAEQAEHERRNAEVNAYLWAEWG